MKRPCGYLGITVVTAVDEARIWSDKSRTEVEFGWAAGEKKNRRDRGKTADEACKKAGFDRAVSFRSILNGREY